MHLQKSGLYMTHEINFFLFPSGSYILIGSFFNINVPSSSWVMYILVELIGKEMFSSCTECISGTFRSLFLSLFYWI